MTYLTLPNGETFTVDNNTFTRSDGVVVNDIKLYWEMVKPDSIR